MKLSSQLIRVCLGCILTGCSGATAGNVDSTSRTRVDLMSPTEAFMLEFDRDLFVSSDTVSWPIRDVRAKLPNLYAALGLRDAGFLPNSAATFGAVNVKVRRNLSGVPVSRFVACGSAVTPRADTHDISLSVLTSIDSLSETATRVRSRVRAVAADPAIPGSSVQCTTTTRLEKRIAELLDSP